jgi:hypothetical protein
MDFFALLKKPSAFVPLVMSLAALATVLLAVAFGATAPPPRGVRPDEGMGAHLFQLLMVAQVPLILFFIIRWLHGSVKSGMQVLLVQAAAAVAALAPVFLLHL